MVPKGKKKRLAFHNMLIKLKNHLHHIQYIFYENNQVVIVMTSKYIMETEKKKPISLDIHISFKS